MPTGSVIFDYDSAMWESNRLAVRIREELQAPVPRFMGPENHKSNWSIVREAMRGMKRTSALMVTDIMHASVQHLLKFPFVKRVFVSFDGGELPEEVKDFHQFTPEFLLTQKAIYGEHIKRCADVPGPVQLELRFVRKFLTICSKIRAFAGVSQLGCLMTKNISFVAVWSAIEAAHRGAPIV